MVRKRNTLAGLLGLWLVLAACGLLTAPEPHPGSTYDSPENIVTNMPSVLPPTQDATPEIVVPVTGSGEEPLTLTELNTVAPSDVIQEMYLYAGGGGGSVTCLYPPEENSDFRLPQPRRVELQYCWDDPDTSVELTVTTPGQKQEVYSLPVKQGSGKRYLVGTYQADLTRPAGRYHFQLRGAQRSLSFSVTYDPPVLPVVYEVFSISDELHWDVIPRQHRLHLAGFAANEPLRLVLYQRPPNLYGVIQFIGWQNVTAGADGQAWVDFELERELEGSLSASVIGPTSGEVHLFEQEYPGADSLGGFQAACPGALPSRMYGQPSVRTIKPLKLYEEPGVSSDIAGEVKAGSILSVNGGPYCKENRLWWYVSDDGSGYVMESAGAEYLLEPAP